MLLWRLLRFSARKISNTFQLFAITGIYENKLWLCLLALAQVRCLLLIHSADLWYFMSAGEKKKAESATFARSLNDNLPMSFMAD